jgi:hypothetical protein
MHQTPIYGPQTIGRHRRGGGHPIGGGGAIWVAAIATMAGFVRPLYRIVREVLTAPNAGLRDFHCEVGFEPIRVLMSLEKSDLEQVG